MPRQNREARLTRAGVTEYRCRRCRRWKNIQTGYYPDKRNFYGIKTTCKMCQRVHYHYGTNRVPSIIQAGWGPTSVIEARCLMAWLQRWLEERGEQC